MKISFQKFLLLIAILFTPTLLFAQGVAHTSADTSRKSEEVIQKPIPIDYRSKSLKTHTVSQGTTFEVGQKIKIGKGSGENGSFRFVRLFSKRPYRYSEESEKKALNYISPADASLTGSELTIHKIVFGQGRKKSPNEYWLIYVPSGGLFRIEVELEPALKSGELMTP